MGFERSVGRELDLEFSSGSARGLALISPQEGSTGSTGSTGPYPTSKAFGICPSESASFVFCGGATWADVLWENLFRGGGGLYHEPSELSYPNGVGNFKDLLPRVKISAPPPYNTLFFEDVEGESEGGGLWCVTH